MTTGRSPNYPSIPLREAIERVRPLYHGIHTRIAEREVIAQNLGYKGLNGRSLTMIASLVGYGLLIKEGKGRLRVSERTVSIMELDKGNPDRANAISESAFAPPVFALLGEDFGEAVVKDDALKYYLVKRGFLPSAAEDIIRVYRDNLELAQEEDREYDAPVPAEPSPIDVRHRSGGIRATDPRAATDFFTEPSINRHELKFNISRETQALVQFVGGDVTQEAIDKLSRLLELQKDTFPTADDLRTLKDYASGKITLDPSLDPD